MNTQEMIRLADFIEKVDDDAFDMSYYWNPESKSVCGTAGCLAGWHAHMTKKRIGNMVHFNWQYEAGRDLGITTTQGQLLFSSAGWWAVALRELGLREGWAEFSTITAKEASLVLRALVEGRIKLEEG